jgi:rsbT co-antagonist protein RsbR
MTRHQITLTLLLFLLAGSIMSAVQSLFALSAQPVDTGASVLSVLLFGALAAAHFLRWRWSSQATLICLIALIGLAAEPEYVRSQIVVASLVPAVIASLLFKPRWPLIVFVATLAVIALRVITSSPSLSAESFGPTFSLLTLSQLFLVVGGMALGSTLARQSQQAVEDSANQANAARQQAEAQAHELETQVAAAQAARAEAEAANKAVEQQLRTIERQQEVIREMSVPILPITASSLLMPLVGALDTVRLQIVQEQALMAIERSRARHLILDITGVPIVDTQVAQGLVQIVRAARLLGTRVVLVGIRPEVAQTVVGLGIALDGIVTHQSLREGMAYVLAAGH